MNPVLKGYVRLTRPANLPTAAADILAGLAVSGVSAVSNIASFPILLSICLVLASVLLYAGGVVLNDAFDHKIDTIERPERPIPSGLISLKSAIFFGATLLLLGVLLAFFVNQLSGIIALLLALAIIAYDGFSKRYEFLGPLNMGFCRSLNLLLGMSILGGITYWYFAIIPLIYIYAITLISRGEVHGNNKSHIIWAGVLYAIVVSGIVGVVMLKTEVIVQTIPFLLLFVFAVYRPLVKAYRLNSPKNIKKAVISGVLSLIVLDAAWAAGFSTWWHGLLILLLLPLSMILSKVFSVT